MKKTGPPKSGKIGMPSVGKTAKVGTTMPSGGKLPSISTSKSYVSPSYATQKKTSTFGIIWLPTRKRNKHKDAVFNSNRNDRSYDRGPSMYNFMSGDSSNQHTFLKKKDEDIDLLVPGITKNTSLAVVSAGAGSVAASEVPPDISTNPEEKQEFIKHNKEGDKETYDEANEMKNDYLDSEKGNTPKIQSDKDKIEKLEKEKVGDNVDSVFLRSPPAHKTRSTVSTTEDEGCGIKCLYYTLQCCDCVLM